MDPQSQKSRALTGSKKHQQTDCDPRSSKSLPDCLVEAANKTRTQVGSPMKGATNPLKDVYNGLITSKELIKVMDRVYPVEQQSSTIVSLFSALKFELDRACANVGKLIVERNSNRSDVEILLKHFEKAKAFWKLKEQDRICSAVKSIAGELETEKKLRRQTERLNKKLGRELAETKVALTNTKKELENETRARKILEQVCDELAQGIGEDRAEVEELMKQFEEVQESVEKEREMLQVADVLREERVHMKLSEAKFQFEEKHALVDKLRYELETYLKGKGSDDDDRRTYRSSDSPRYDKIKELQMYLRETLPGGYQDQKKEEIDAGNGGNELDGDDSAETDLHSIELDVDDTGQAFPWSDGVGIESRRNPSCKSKGRKKSMMVSTNYSNGGEEDEIERYNMIKDLRDHIVSGSRSGLSREFERSGENLAMSLPMPKTSVVVTSKDSNQVTCCQG
ncbi:WEB family protein At5g16730, chloroplastic-like isoform X2 [Andrographis paniculata]|uniref:WEB family protein At5g16730, chloroplastic-like isoform X2 n=1 Tax=Andrographis paniculata TaxID=175694 RepID=UPI0021E73D40|nr:WEB family protein At5g16730, chloroplastic-like isoform X2 [Andrographis paniculata]